MTNANNDPTGLESADTSSAYDSRKRRREERIRILAAAYASCEAIHEHNAASEIFDVIARQKAEAKFEAACEASERQRRSEGLHGQDPSEEALKISDEQSATAI